MNIVQKITVEFETSNGGTIKKSFMGEWLVNDVSPKDDNSGVQWGNVEFSVAKTAKGALAVYTGDSLEVYDSFEAFLNAEYVYPENLIAEVAGALGIAYEIELDI